MVAKFQFIITLVVLSHQMDRMQKVLFVFFYFFLWFVRRLKGVRAKFWHTALVCSPNWTILWFLYALENVHFIDSCHILLFKKYSEWDSIAELLLVFFSFTNACLNFSSTLCRAVHFYYYCSDQLNLMRPCAHLAAVAIDRCRCALSFAILVYCRLPVLHSSSVRKIL